MDEQRQLTRVGKQLARLPVDPRIARMLLAGHQLDCLAEVTDHRRRAGGAGSARAAGSAGAGGGPGACALRRSALGFPRVAQAVALLAGAAGGRVRRGANRIAPSPRASAASSCRCGGCGNGRTCTPSWSRSPREMKWSVNQAQAKPDPVHRACSPGCSATSATAPRTTATTRARTSRSSGSIRRSALGRKAAARPEGRGARGLPRPTSPGEGRPLGHGRRDGRHRAPLRAHRRPDPQRLDRERRRAPDRPLVDRSPLGEEGWAGHGAGARRPLRAGRLRQPPGAVWRDRPGAVARTDDPRGPGGRGVAERAAVHPPQPRGDRARSSAWSTRSGGPTCWSTSRRSPPGSTAGFPPTSTPRRRSSAGTGSAAPASRICCSCRATRCCARTPKASTASAFRGTW